MGSLRFPVIETCGGFLFLFFTRFFNNTCPVKAMWYFPNEIRCPPVHFHLNPFSKSSLRNSPPVIVECSIPNNSEAIYVCGFFRTLRPPSSQPIKGTLWPYIWRSQDIAVGLMIPLCTTCNDFYFFWSTQQGIYGRRHVFHRCIKCIKLCYRSTVQEFH